MLVFLCSDIFERVDFLVVHECCFAHGFKHALGGFGEGVSADVDDVLVRYHIFFNKIRSEE